jgi:acyl-coenzyme A synthetase/AMP-(fatty) acid ligase
MANSDRVVFVDSIPVGGTGKVLKKDLRATMAQFYSQWNKQHFTFIHNASRKGR